MQDGSDWQALPAIGAFQMCVSFASFFGSRSSRNTNFWQSLDTFLCGPPGASTRWGKIYVLTAPYFAARAREPPRADHCGHTGDLLHSGEEAMFSLTFGITSAHLVLGLGRRPYNSGRGGARPDLSECARFPGLAE
jgi:hypothetical protein